MTMTQISERHQILPRRVQFDLKDVPVHWLRDDPFGSHLINGIHLLLPAGEFFFCRVYNKALPLITDPQLRADVQGFIRQEAIHARVHEGGQDYLRKHNYDTEGYIARANLLFGKLLSDAPLGMPVLQRKFLEKHWLILRVGVIAAIEHFTGLLGDWALNHKGWEKNGDPTITDLFTWHLAEEVEHRTVAFDLFQHLCQTQLGFYVSRQVLMAAIFPLFIHFIADGFRHLALQDKDSKESYKIARSSIVRLLFELERQARRTDNVPTFSFLVAGTLRWISPSFHPETEGDTQQALDYMARSPAARAAAAQEATRQAA